MKQFSRDLLVCVSINNIKKSPTEINVHKLMNININYYRKKNKSKNNRNGVKLIYIM